ncbi:MAG TPA: bifunctional GNAT family N-acetyltransferase/class I SAM-dependent methyltransferase [Actinomycetota bacterium]|nr:bifunctional GNAT family N-acetyltransferase/class I SAM-dependent methyltransferase [Actinomycetota bacterium]
MDVVLETDRLLLRYLTLDDCPYLDEILGDAETMRHYPRPYTFREVEAWVVRNLESYRDYGFGLWAVIRKEDGKFVGQCGLVPQDVEGTREIEVGWHVNRAFWRRGYASEAAAAARDYAFDIIGLTRLVSLVLPANVPSQGVARKIGMIPERIVGYRGRDHLLFVCPASGVDEVGRTRATYDVIAEDYVSHPANRDASRRGRERFVARLPTGARVADIGCGPGRDLVLLRDAGLEVVGIDLSPAMARRAARSGAPVVAGDMRRLPAADAAFDGVWASASILHIPAHGAPRVVEGFRRALRPGGVLFASVKLGRGEAWAVRDRHPRFFTYYTDDSLDALLEESGFGIEEEWREDDALGREPWLNRIAARR